MKRVCGDCGAVSAAVPALPSSAATLPPQPGTGVRAAQKPGHVPQSGKWWGWVGFWLDCWVKGFLACENMCSGWVRDIMCWLVWKTWSFGKVLV